MELFWTRWGSILVTFALCSLRPRVYVDLLALASRLFWERRLEPRGLILEALLDFLSLRLTRQTHRHANTGEPQHRLQRNAGHTFSALPRCPCVPIMLGRRVPALALTIRRPPLAVRRACLRRRAFYASPCQATAPSLERFTHRAHSAGPLRPEVELTPSKVRKSNSCFIDFRCFFKTILGSKMEANMRSKSCQNRAWAPSKTLLEPGCRWKPFWPPFLTYVCTPRTTKNNALAVARCHFLQKWPVAPGGPKSTPKSPQKSRPKGARWRLKPSPKRI